MNTRLALIPALTLLASACGAPDFKPPPAPAVAEPRKPFTANERQAIQVVGRAVLEARGHAAEDPDILALNQELRDLREDVKKAIAPRPGSLILAPSQSQKAAASTAAPDERVSAVTLRLDSLRARRLRLSSRVSEKGSPELAGRLAALAGAAEAIEKETREALALPASERVGRLMKLDAKLENRSPTEEMRREQVRASAPAPERTPTLTTITTHR